MKYCEPHDRYFIERFGCDYCTTEEQQLAEWDKTKQDHEHQATHATGLDTAADWTVFLMQHLDCKHLKTDILIKPGYTVEYLQDLIASIAD